MRYFLQFSITVPPIVFSLKTRILSLHIHQKQICILIQNIKKRNVFFVLWYFVPKFYKNSCLIFCYFSKVSNLEFRHWGCHKTKKVNKKWRHIFLSAFLQLDKSDNEDGVYVASGSANIILYVGLGMICIGLVITFVGLGDKGFRTLELKLIGPSLVGCGVFFALLRVLFCTVPSCCRACCKCCGKTEDKEELIYATVSVSFISMERSILVKKKS